MNTVQLIGRLTRDPEVRYSQGSVPLKGAYRQGYSQTRTG